AARLVRGLVKEPDLNYRHVRVSESTRYDELEAFAEEYPMMSPHRLLWVDGIDKLSPPAREALTAYIPRRPPTAVLVLSGPTLTDGGRRGKAGEGPSLEDVAAQNGMVVLCDIRVPDLFGRGPDDRPA